jgi:hypothetical protein
LKNRKENVSTRKIDEKLAERISPKIHVANINMRVIG